MGLLDELDELCSGMIVAGFAAAVLANPFYIPAALVGVAVGMASENRSPVRRRVTRVIQKRIIVRQKRKKGKPKKTKRIIYKKVKKKPVPRSLTKAELVEKAKKALLADIKLIQSLPLDEIEMAGAIRERRRKFVWIVKDLIR